MKCPICNGNAAFEKRNLNFDYKGHEILLEGIEGIACKKCNEFIMDEANSSRFLALINEFKKGINSEE